MATVYLLSVAPETPEDNSWARSACRLIEESAALNPAAKHSLTDDPQKADIILFAELGGNGPYDEHIRAHPIFQAYRQKCYLFANTAHTLALIPGVYTWLERPDYNPQKARSGFYLHATINPYIKHTPWPSEAPYLYSFVGTLKNHPVRQKILNLKGPHALIEDTAGTFVPALEKGDQGVAHAMYRRFSQVMEESQCVLCPRGVGPSSVRIFETMHMGRVPVILSDNWVPPMGPDWSTCAIRIPENKVSHTPDILRERQEELPKLAQNAYTAWEDYFSPPNAFHTIVEYCLDIENTPKALPEWLRYRLGFLNILKPFHLRNYLRTRLRS